LTTRSTNRTQLPTTGQVGLRKKCLLQTNGSKV